MQASSAALNGRTSTKDRICRYRCRMFPCAIHTIRCHSQSTAYWQFLNRESRPHLPNSLFLRLRSGSLQPDRQLYFVFSIQKPPKLVNVEGNAVLGNSHFHPLHSDLCTYT